MKANDQTDLKFVTLQNDLNDNRLAPCVRIVTSTDDASERSCLQRIWNEPGFCYNPDAIKIVRKNLCASCMASWLVAVARNYMLGLL